MDFDTCQFPEDEKTQKLDAEKKSSSSLLGFENSRFSEDCKQRSVSPLYNPAGLVNLGNTCYMNTSLHVLFITLKDHLDQLRSIKAKDNYIHGCSLALELEKLITMHQSYRYVHPMEFERLFGSLDTRFAGFEQEDAQEFMEALLWQVHNEINEAQVSLTSSETVSTDDMNLLEYKFIIIIIIISLRKSFVGHRPSPGSSTAFYLASFVSDNFQGLMRNKSLCLYCTAKTVKFQPFMILSIPFPPSRTNLTLKSLLSNLNDYTFSPDRRCEKCKRKGILERNDVYRLPSYLIIHLCRYGFSIKELMPYKIDDFVHFPLENLEIEEYGSDGEKTTKSYDLYGVVNHHGMFRFGHYTAFVNCDNHTWCVCDDIHVGRIMSSDVVSSSAYIMLYKVKSS